MILTRHICNKECSFSDTHTASTNINSSNVNMVDFPKSFNVQTSTSDNDSVIWFTEHVNRINIEFGHIVIYFTSKKWYCLNCSIFNPRILYHAIRSWFK